MTKTTTGRGREREPLNHNLRERIIASRDRNLARIMRQKGHGWIKTAIVLRIALFFSRLGLPLSLNATALLLLICLFAGITIVVFILQ